jgi:hypothetical protein
MYIRLDSAIMRSAEAQNMDILYHNAMRRARAFGGGSERITARFAVALFVRKTALRYNWYVFYFEHVW